jgi:hypothetical protein
MLIALAVHLATTGGTPTPDYYLVDPGTFQAFLAVVGLVMVALAGYSANKARVNAKKLDRTAVKADQAATAATLVGADVKAVKDSVVNDHKHDDGSPVGLRDDNDDKHIESMAAIEQVGKDLRAFAKTTNGKFNTIGKDIGGMRQELRVVRSHAEGSDERILDLEKTTPRAEVREAVAAVRARKPPTRKATP